MNTTKGRLFLIPIALAPDSNDKFINNEIIRLIKRIDYYFVENVRTARRFIGSLKVGKDIDDLHFFVLDKNTAQEELLEKLDLLEKGFDVGVMSEAGCPGVADPGGLMVSLAHEKGISVVPLVGPSSILLALMSSGFNGQQFTFHGYLPIEKAERKDAIKNLERELVKTGYTQIFIETPYRNDKLLADLLQYLQPQTKLCVAANLTAEDAFIKALTVAKWKKEKPLIGKVPAIFLVGY